MNCYETDKKIGQVRPKEILILGKQMKNKSIFIKIDLAFDPFKCISEQQHIVKREMNVFFVE